MSAALSSKLLEGTTILELGDGLAVGYAGRVLRSLGATVIKVESLEDPDWVRHYGVPCPDHPSLSCTSCHLNGGKVRALLDSREAATDDLLQRLLGVVDITLLGEGALAARVADVPDESASSASIIRIVGAVDEPAGLRIAPDEAAGVATGLRDLYGDERPPTGHRFDVAQVNAGAHAAATASTALASRALGRSEPVRVDVGVYESSFSMIEIAVQTLLLAGRFDEGYPDIISSPLGAPYPCRDGRSLVINLYGKEVWRRMCDAMGQPDQAEDERFLTTVSMWSHGEELRAILDEWCRNLDRDDAIARMREQRIPCAPVYDLDELVADQHVQARGIVSRDAGHANAALAACYVIDGERPDLSFLPLDDATQIVRSLGVDGLSAEPREALDAVLIKLQ